MAILLNIDSRSYQAFKGMVSKCTSHSWGLLENISIVPLNSTIFFLFSKKFKFLI